MRRFGVLDNPGNDPKLDILDLTGLVKKLESGDLTPPQPVFQFKLVADAGNIQYSPNSKMILVSGSDVRPRLYDAENGQLLREVIGHTGIVQKAVFSPDGQTILSASEH